MSLTQTIPAMPVRDMPAAVSFYRDATLDLDGNLVTFFEWRSE